MCRRERDSVSRSRWQKEAGPGAQPLIWVRVSGPGVTPNIHSHPGMDSGLLLDLKRHKQGLISGWKTERAPHCRWFCLQKTKLNIKSRAIDWRRNYYLLTRSREAASASLWFFLQRCLLLVWTLSPDGHRADLARHDNNVDINTQSANVQSSGLQGPESNRCCVFTPYGW